MFMGPYDEGGDWNDKGIKGIYRFLNKIWRLIHLPDSDSDDKKTIQLMHHTIKIVTDNLNDMKFNTAISRLMELVNHLTQYESISPEVKKNLILLIAPLAPHLSEELWIITGNKSSIFDVDWPAHDPSKLETDEITIVVQINGKLRASMNIQKDLDKDAILEQSKQLPNISKYLDDSEIIKEIYVPGKLINFVVK